MPGIATQTRVQTSGVPGTGTPKYVAHVPCLAEMQIDSFLEIRAYIVTDSARHFDLSGVIQQHTSHTHLEPAPAGPMTSGTPHPVTRNAATVLS